jgi:hypothetical protein
LLAFLVELRDDRPVPDLAGLGHGEELEPVQRVVLAAEVGLAHLGRLALDLAGLVEDRGLLALERRTSASLLSSLVSVANARRRPPLPWR